MNKKNETSLLSAICSHILCWYYARTDTNGEPSTGCWSVNGAAGVGKYKACSTFYQGGFDVCSYG